MNLQLAVVEEGCNGVSYNFKNSDGFSTSLESPDLSKHLLAITIAV